MDFVSFMSSTAGRALRIVAGLILIVLALFGPNWSTGIEIVLLILGIVFVVVGALNLCLLAPLFGKPIKGGK